MVKIAEMDDVEQLAWKLWVEERPEPVRSNCLKYPPDLLYRIKSTGHRVYIVSYSEDGTVTVSVGAEYNLVAFERHVFGVDPNELEECDLPGPDDRVGFIHIHASTKTVQ